MRAVLAYVAVVASIFMAFPVQEMLPPVLHFFGARILLVPALFTYGALAFPLPAMLGLAVITGLLSDLAYLHVVAGRVEIGLGWSIVYFVIAGLVAGGFRPMFLRGHWWIHIPVAVLVTSMYLALQFLMITLRREGFVFNEVAAWRIVGSGLMAGLVSPFIHGAVWLAMGREANPAKHFVRA
jgi:hypothetical protein